MIDNLTEAISHAREVAKKQYERAYELHDKAVELDKNGLDSSEVREEGKACFSCYYEHCQLADLLEELAERREADRWISVKERLPEDYTKVLITNEYGIVTCITWSTWYQNECKDARKEYKAIAWKPKPEPYESEDK